MDAFLFTLEEYKAIFIILAIVWAIVILSVVPETQANPWRNRIIATSMAFTILGGTVIAEEYMLRPTLGPAPVNKPAADSPSIYWAEYQGVHM